MNDELTENGTFINIEYHKSRVSELEKQLAKYDEIAAEYGIDGKTMLTLAKSQIETAKENIVLREHLKAEREKGCWACRDAKRIGFTNMGSRIYLERNETGYVISDRYDNAVEVYFCPECGKRLEVEQG